MSTLAALDSALPTYTSPVNNSDALGVLAQLSTAALRAELEARQDEDLNYRPPCGSGVKNGYYNTELHIGAVFIILGLSVLGM